MRRITSILSKYWLLIAIIIAGIFLRFFNFAGVVTFLGDQGRDAIVLKRILTLEHFPAIGAPTSVGQVYLGPFYYYFIAPWLLLFNFNPIGPAIGVALFSCLYLLINYLIVDELFDKKVAIVSTILISFSFVLIELSRFSWNPNLMPLFALLTIYFFIKSLRSKNWKFHILFGSFLSFSIQLHYLALFLIPPAGIITFLYFLTNKKHFLKNTLNLTVSFFSFVFFSFPLIIFDLRHQFLNTNNFINLFKGSAQTKTNLISNLINTFQSLNQYSFAFKFDVVISSIIFVLILIILFTLIKSNKPITIFLVFFIFLILGFSLYGGDKHPHYFGVIYPVYFIIIGYFISLLLSGGYEKYLALLFIVAFVFLNYQKYYFIKNSGDGQLERSRKIAQIILDKVNASNFTVTALPEKYSDSTYRYYLEVWKKRPIEKDSLEKADELFLVCEKKCSPIIGNPQWDIAYFAPNKIVGEWKVDDVKIYKLIR